MNEYYIKPDEKISLQAVSLFGLESVTADELKRMGFSDVRTETGRVSFSGTFADIAKANIGLRTAERVLIYMGGGRVTSFTELFDTVKALPWEKFLSLRCAFPVKGHSLDSTLHSVPDAQAIIKKAVVERMRSVYPVEWFDEDGERCRIQFSIIKDELAISIDTSGDGLHKRGYRENAGIAPLRETLAAGILLLSRYRGYESFIDPMCGSGTFLIEAGLIAQNRAPGLRRSFDAEKWACAPNTAFPDARREAIERIRPLPCHIHGSDRDPEMVALTLENAAKAGLGEVITAEIKDMRDVKETYDVLVTNPPYGERMADKKAASDTARYLSSISATRRYIITSDETFESFYRSKATKKRKLYNGMIKCDLYMYLPGKETRFVPSNNRSK